MDRVENLLKVCLEDDEYEEHAFQFIIEDDVYDGPNLGLYGGIEDSEEAKNFTVEYYKQYDERFDTSSCIHLFPVFEEFKSKFTTLSKSFLIYHNVTVTLNDKCTLTYQVYNYSEGMGTENIIEMTRVLSMDELKNIMVQVFMKYPNLDITDIYAGVYKF